MLTRRGFLGALGAAVATAQFVANHGDDTAFVQGCVDRGEWLPQGTYYVRRIETRGRTVLFRGSTFVKVPTLRNSFMLDLRGCNPGSVVYGNMFCASKPL